MTQPLFPPTVNELHQFIKNYSPDYDTRHFHRTVTKYEGASQLIKDILTNGKETIEIVSNRQHETIGVKIVSYCNNSYYKDTPRVAQEEIKVNLKTGSYILTHTDIHMENHTYHYQLNTDNTSITQYKDSRGDYWDTDMEPSFHTPNEIFMGVIQRALFGRTKEEHVTEISFEEERIHLHEMLESTYRIVCDFKKSEYLRSAENIEEINQ